MNWYIQALKKYAVLNGRARRKEYWYFTLFFYIIVIVLSLIDMLIGTYDEKSGAGLLSTIYVLAMFIPYIAVGARRLQDTDHTGWWLLVGLIPIIGPIVLLVLFVRDSTPGENRYGPNPKESGQ